MNLASLKRGGHAPTLLAAFLHFDTSFMVWVILGAMAPFLTADPELTGVNLRLTPSPGVTAAGQYTLLVKGPDVAKGQPANVYNLLVKPGDPSTATRGSVRPVEAFVVDNADPASVARVNSTSRLIHVEVAPTAHGNPNENVVPLKPASAGAQAVANGYPASLKLTLVGIPLLAAAFWRILLGLLADRFGSKRVGVASMAATLLPLVIGWQFANSYATLGLLGFFLGIAGASFAVALPLASRWYPPHLQGLAMGIAGAGNSGTVLATLFAPILARWVGWHGVFGLLMIPVSLTLLVFVMLAKEPPRRGEPARLGDFVAVLRQRDAWAFCALYFVTFGGFVGLSSFFNTFFVDQYDAPKAAVGMWTWPFIVAGSFVRPIGGALADRLGGIRMLTILFGVTALTAGAVAAVIGNFPAACVALFLLMSALGMGNGSVFQLIPQRFKREIGVITGLVGAAGGIGGYYLTFVLGHLHDATGSYATGFLSLGLLAGVALALLRGVAKGWSRTWLGEGGLAPTAPTSVEVTETSEKELVLSGR